MFARLPQWIYWVAFFIGVAAIGAAAWFGVRQHSVVIPAEFVSRRNGIIQLLVELNATPSVDVAPLADAENKKEYAAASALLEKAIEANAAHQAIIQKLARTSDGLSALATQIKPDTLSEKAIVAFGILHRLVIAEQSYYESQRSLFTISKQYYDDAITSGVLPAVPAEVQKIADAASKSLAEMQDLNKQFKDAIDAFDKEAAGNK